MILRRVFYYWQFVAVGALPLWLMVAASIFGSSAWEVLGATFGAIAIGFGLLVVSLLFLARKEVRAVKAVSWADVGVLALWHVLIVLMGVFSVTAPWLSVLVVLVGLGAFWFALWELFDAARTRVREAMVYIDETARFGTVPAGPNQFPPMNDRSGVGADGARQDPAPTTPADPSVIIIREKLTDP
ncbi:MULTISPECIES: MFS transporter [unclassified Cryobacterium]|uniref:MFS transporter n=1 Tax=unclassified Cryobacterium TaxID=2649013 RepID=UPI00106D4A43|nr:MULTISPECIES: MFS transporter [unclassified Cryobacterium]TFC58132.1 MFS transporter [Cryobacterium sp. TMB3-1-2]TFC71207.1 MFS transporter [Cryobacterium sp. TMB3-15]TFC79318.1 MFS transporter [Cryobacterium sp. TMB3-10]TFD38022.1 MFS transporter [Cryobacterium sp. TMB3-12]